jgi:hypothetical protein
MADTDTDYLQLADPISRLSAFLADKLSPDDIATAEELIADALGVSQGGTELGLAKVAADSARAWNRSRNISAADQAQMLQARLDRAKTQPSAVNSMNVAAMDRAKLERRERDALRSRQAGSHAPALNPNFYGR